MGTTTSKLALFKPAGSDLVDEVVDLNNNWDKLDNNIGAFVCTSATRPVGGSRFTGQEIFETDTNLSYRWNGSVWVAQFVQTLNQRATSNTTVNSTSDTDIIGATVTAVADVNRTLDIWGMFDASVTAFTSSTAVSCECFVDGAKIAGQAGVYVPRQNGDRTCVTGVWSIAVGAGSHPVKLTARLSAANLTISITSGNSGIKVQVV